MATSSKEVESLEVPNEGSASKKRERMEKKSDHSSFDSPNVPSKVSSYIHNRSNYDTKSDLSSRNGNSSVRNKHFTGKIYRDVNPPRFLPLSTTHHPLRTNQHHHQGVNYSGVNYSSVNYSSVNYPSINYPGLNYSSVNYPGLNYLSKNKPVSKQRSIQSNHTIGSQSSREGLLLLSSGDELDDEAAHSPLHPTSSFPFPNTDGTDVRQMEQGLLQLLDDFHCGKLQAFGKDITFEKMEQVREKQERLARLHFELMAIDGSSSGNESEEGRLKNRDSMNKLMGNLQELSSAIEQLQSKSGGTSSKT